MLWVFYGLPFNHPNITLVITTNGTDLVLEIIYLSAFLRYGTNKPSKIFIWLLIEAICLAVIAIIDLKLFHSHKAQFNFMGIFCVVFGVIMYGSPLTIMWKVIRTNSIEFMPLALSLAAFLNAVCWTTYALLKFDPYMLVKDIW